MASRSVLFGKGLVRVWFAPTWRAASSICWKTVNRVWASDPGPPEMAIIFRSGSCCLSS